MNAIVTVNVSQQVAPIPSTLQRTGALISVGGTTLEPNTSLFLPDAATLTAHLTPGATLSGLTWAAGVVTATATAALPYSVSDTVDLTIEGAAPAGYNGTFLCTITGANTFTYDLASNPGAETAFGTWTPGSVAELQSMVNTYFAQGTSVALFAGAGASAGAGNGIYVLELGPEGINEAVNSLAKYLSDPPLGSVKFYAFLIPRDWDVEDETDLLALVTAYSNPTGLTYFYITTGAAGNYTGQKAAFTVIEAATKPAGEFTAAAFLYKALSYNPSSANLVAPMEWAYVYGVTPDPLSAADQVTDAAEGANWVGTGAEGGISNLVIVNGQFADKSPFNYWYAVDWVVINVSQALAAAVINGSNTPTNPLYYNQAGINSLQKVAQNTVNNGISFGIILPPAPVAAVPFAQYVEQNPGDYAIGRYAGLSLTFTPARGFAAIVVNLVASNIPQ